MVTMYFGRILFLMCLLSLMISAPLKAAQIDADILLDALVDEGVMTHNQAKQILKKSMARQDDRDKNDAHIQTAKATNNEDITIEKVNTSLFRPKSISLHGDLTLRYDYTKIKSADTPMSQSRGRLRYRLGVDTFLNEKLKVAAGITSSDADPRSSFYTFGHSSQKADARLDYAYAEYMPQTWLKGVMGIFPREEYLWSPSDMMWDSDIHPQGGAVHLQAPYKFPIKAGLNAGAMVLDENFVRQDDPSLFYFQPNLSYDDNTFDAKVSMQAYVFNSVKGSQLAYSTCTNSGLVLVGDNCGGTTLTHEYDSRGMSIETGYSFDWLGKKRRIAIFGDYLRNITLSDEDVAWAAGGHVGDKSLIDPMDWRLTYQYTVIQRDSILDIFPSSDRYNGQTNVMGIKAGLQMMLWKDVSMNVQYFRDRYILSGDGFDTTPRTYISTDIQYRF